MEKVEVDFQENLKEQHVGADYLMVELESILVFYSQPQLWNPHQQGQTQNRSIMMFGTNGTGKSFMNFLITLVTIVT